MTEITARLKPLKGESSRILKLCVAKDINTALQGLELARAIGSPLEGLLDEVGVDETGQLIRGKRFTSKDKTQAFLDALLFIQLSLAAKGSAEAKLRNNIKVIDCKLPVLVDFSHFSCLKTLKITFNGSFKGDDLRGLGTLSKLKSLTFSCGIVMYGEQAATLASLKGLNAPLLEEFDSANLDLFDIDDLSRCSKLKRVNLHGNQHLKNIDSLASSANTLVDLDIGYCRAISSLKPLRKAIKLRYLDMGAVNLVNNLLDLKNLTNLASINLYGCEGITSFKGLPLDIISDFYRATESVSDSFILNDLKSLKSFEYLPPLGPYVTELRVNRAPALTDLSQLRDPTGSVVMLQLNQVAIKNLDFLASMANLEKIEISECDELVDATALSGLTKLTTVRFNRCKNLQSMPEAWKSPVKNLAIRGCGALLPLKGLPLGIDSKTIEIDDRKLLPRAKPTKALKAEVGAVWKLLSSRELANILIGLELSVGLEPQDLNALIAEVTVKAGKLIRGKRFTGTGPAQPYLDMALIGLLARAPKEDKLTKLRLQISELELTLLRQAFPLDGFVNLKKLTLHTGEEETSDLTGFGIMPKLTHLKITGERWGSNGALKSLNGLKAPCLQDVDLSYCKIENISALSLSPKIRKLTLSNNPNLTTLRGLEACTSNLVELDLQDCERLSCIELLKDAKNLKSLNLYACSHLTSITSLASCKSLQTIKLEQCSQLSSLEGLAELSLKPEKSYDGNTQFSLDGCCALKSLTHLPSLGGKLTTLSIEHTTSLKNLEGLTELTSVHTLSANHSGISDLQLLSSLPALTHISLRNCKQLIDVRPLGLLKKLEEVNLSNSAVTYLPSAWLGPVDHLVLQECHNLTSLGMLPSSLINLICDESSALLKLDGMVNCQKLEHLSIKSCSALEDLGRPPNSLKEMMAQGCLKLTTLKGLEACANLATVALPTSIVDMGSIEALANVQISIDLFELGKPKIKGQLVSLPSAFIDAVNKLPAARLKIKGPTGSWYEPRTIDLNMFGKFKTVTGLNFDEMDFHSKLEEMGWLVNMERLESLIFYPRGSMSHSLNGGIFDTPRKVKALQLKICEVTKTKPPFFLLA